MMMTSVQVFDTITTTAAHITMAVTKKEPIRINNERQSNAAPLSKPTRTVRRFERRMEDVNGFNYQI